LSGRNTKWELIAVCDFSHCSRSRQGSSEGKCHRDGGCGCDVCALWKSSSTVLRLRLANLSEAARKALDMLPQNYEYQFEGFRRAKAEGKAEGEAKGLAAATAVDVAAVLGG
jgi:hypothetical protein